MKKSFLIVAVAMGLKVSGQSSLIITNINGTKTITANSIINVQSEDSVTTSVDFDVRNISNTTNTYKVKRYDIVKHTVPGDTAHPHFCFAGQCYSFGDRTSLSAITLTANQTATQYQAQVGLPNQYLEVDIDETQTPTVGYSYVKYTFFNTSSSSPNDTIQFSVKYNDAAAVGVNTTEKTVTSISIFPNPSSGASVLKFNSSRSFPAHLTLFNSLGQALSDKDIAIIEGRNKIQLDTEGLTSGVYFVSVKSGESTITRKLIIN